MFNKTNPMSQAHMASMYNTMSNFKKMQQSKILSRMNELDKNRDRLQLDKDELRNAIIKPIRVEKSDKQEALIKMRDLERTFTKPEMEQMWSKRTNQDYKNIIKDEKYKKKDYKKKEDLIIHKVTDLDKVGVKKEFEDFQGKLETQNGELKIQYSQSKELEHKKKFEYNNKYKYAVKFNPKAHGDMKDENIEYFKKEQEKVEKDKKKIDDIIQTLMSSNLLTDEEKKDLVDLQSEAEETKEEVKNIIKLKENKKQEEPEENEKKPIKITVKTKKLSSDENNINEDTIETKVNEDVRNKYLNRRKIK